MPASAKELSERAKQRVRQAEALEAEVYDLLARRQVEAAEARALAAIDLKRKAYRKHPGHGGMGTAYLALADAQVLRGEAAPALAGRWQAVRSIAANGGEGVLSLYRRAARLFERSKHPKLVETTLLVAAFYKAQQLSRRCVPSVLRAFRAAGAPADVDHATLARGLALVAERADLMIDESNRLAFYGVLEEQLELLPYAEEYLARCEADGASPLEMARALRYVAYLSLGQPGAQERAITLCNRAREILQPVRDEHPLESKQIDATHCAHLIDAGDLATARKRFPKLVVEGPRDVGALRPLSDVLSKLDLDAGDAESQRFAIEQLCLRRQDTHTQPVWPLTCRTLVQELAASYYASRKADPEACALKGLAVLVSRGGAAALSSYQRALKLTKKKPDSAMRHAAVAYVACVARAFDLAAVHSEKAYETLCPKREPESPAGFTAAVNHASILAALGRHSDAQRVMDAAMKAFREREHLRATYAKNERWRFDPIQRLLAALGRFDDVAFAVNALPLSDLLVSESTPSSAARIAGDYREALRLERAYVARYLQQNLSSSTRNFDWMMRVLRRAEVMLDIGLEDEALAELLDVVGAYKVGIGYSAIRRVSAHAQPVRLRSIEGIARAMLRRGLVDQGLGMARRAYATHTAYGNVPDRRGTPPLDRPPQHQLVQPVLEHMIPPLPPLESRAPEIYARALLASGEPEEAVRVVEDSLASLRERVGSRSPRIAQALHVLAQIEVAAGQYQQAQPHAKEALDVTRASLEPGHPTIADVSITAGDIAVLTKAPKAAHAHYDRALQIATKELIPSHVSFPLLHSGKAMAYLVEGKAAEALSSMRTSLDLVATRIETSFVGATSSARIAMSASVQWALANWLAVCDAANETGYDEVLRLKARVGRSMAEEVRVLREAKGSSKEAARALDQARRRLSRLAHRAPRFGWKRLAWRRQVAAAADDVAKKTKLLARASRAFASSRKVPKVSAKLIAKRLVAGEALIDVVLAGGRYVAWIVTKDAPARRVVLGRAEELTPKLQGFRDAVMEVEDVAARAYADAAAAVRESIWKPLVAGLPADTQTLYLVPDGPLAATPFEALPVEGGMFVLDRYQLVRLAAADDLLRRRAAGKSKGVLLVGDVDFNAVAREGAAPAVTGKQKTLLDRVPGLPRFKYLPGTKAEIAWLAQRFKRKSANAPRAVYSGQQASESSVREGAAGKAVLHFATHGFVRENLNVKLRVPEDEVLRLRGGLERHVQSFDPFLMSGLALSGVNTRQTEGLDDGMLTALEVLGFDIEGADLAFLSACETARGVEQAGEGVFGLVRAFSLAGARQVVASLWPVDDDATLELVKHFYESYLSKGRPAAAASLRTAARKLRADDRFKAPRHWAAFGAYGPLR